METGCVGLIFGRNMWQRKWDEALAMSARIHDLLKDFGS
jgi:DhnA family fructose-bisphosphate aldolase class Ia